MHKEQSISGWRLTTLGEIFEYEQPTKYLVSSTDYSDEFETPVLTAGKTFVLGYTDEQNGVYDGKLPCIIFDDFTTDSKFVNFQFKAKSSAMKILHPSIPAKLAYALLLNTKYEIDGHNRHWISIFSNLPVLLPKTPEEQQAISKVLDEWDTAISLYRDKIELAKELKKGMMQKLFTSDTDKWREVRLGDVATMRSGGTPTSTVCEYYGGDIPWVSITDITNSGMYLSRTEKTLTEAGINNSSAHIYNENVILFAMYASLGKVTIPTVNVSSSQAILGIVPGEKLEKMFLYYYLTKIENHIKTLGQTGTQSNLSKEIVQNFKVPLPPLPIQRSIATQLTQMDTEIELLEKKLNSLQKQRKWLLDNLVTGKVRLPEFIINTQNNDVGDMHNDDAKTDKK